MAERIVYDDKGSPVIVDDGTGALGTPRAGASSSRQQRDDVRRRRVGFDAINMIARRPLVGVKKVKPEEEEIVLDETVTPLRRFGYAPQAMLMTNEGSLYTARMRAELQIGNGAIVGTVPADCVVNPIPPVVAPDLIFQLQQPFLSGVVLRVKLFAAWLSQTVRNVTELTIYDQNPLTFLTAVPPVPIPRSAIVFETFHLPVPTPFTPTLDDFESVIDEDINIPYELQFNLQSSGRAGQGTRVIIPLLWLRIAQWVADGEDVVYDWRIEFEDGGR